MHSILYWIFSIFQCIFFSIDMIKYTKTYKLIIYFKIHKNMQEKAQLIFWIQYKFCITKKIVSYFKKQKLLSIRKQTYNYSIVMNNFLLILFEKIMRLWIDKFFEIKAIYLSSMNHYYFTEQLVFFWIRILVFLMNNDETIRYNNNNKKKTLLYLNSWMIHIYSVNVHIILMINFLKTNQYYRAIYLYFNDQTKLNKKDIFLS